MADRIEVLQQEVGIACDAFRTMRVVAVGLGDVLDGDGAAFFDVADDVLNADGFRQNEIEGVDETRGGMRVRTAEHGDDGAFGGLLMILEDAVFGTASIDDFDDVAVHFIEEMVGDRLRDVLAGVRPPVGMAEDSHAAAGADAIPDDMRRGGHPHKLRRQRLAHFGEFGLDGGFVFRLVVFEPVGHAFAAADGQDVDAVALTVNLFARIGLHVGRDVVEEGHGLFGTRVGVVVGFAGEILSKLAAGGDHDGACLLRSVGELAVHVEVAFERTEREEVRLEGIELEDGDGRLLFIIGIDKRQCMDGFAWKTERRFDGVPFDDEGDGFADAILERLPVRTEAVIVKIQQRKAFGLFEQRLVFEDHRDGGGLVGPDHLRPCVGQRGGERRAHKEP